MLSQGGKIVFVTFLFNATSHVIGISYLVGVSIMLHFPCSNSLTGSKRLRTVVAVPLEMKHNGEDGSSGTESIFIKRRVIMFCVFIQSEDITLLYDDNASAHAKG